MGTLRRALSRRSKTSLRRPNPALRVWQPILPIAFPPTLNPRTKLMSPNIAKPSAAWISFSYANMIAALGLTIGGLVALPLDFWIKGYMLMGETMLVTATIILTKTLRDREESSKIINKIEDAKTEQLLMRLDRNLDRP